MVSNATGIQARNTACALNGKNYQPAQQMLRAEAKLLRGSLPSKGRWAIASTYKSMAFSGLFHAGDVTT